MIYFVHKASTALTPQAKSKEKPRADEPYFVRRRNNVRWLRHNSRQTDQPTDHVGPDQTDRETNGWIDMDE